MSQNIELKNFELATVNPSNKTWTSADLFCYWANSIQTVAAFALISTSLLGVLIGRWIANNLPRQRFTLVSGIIMLSLGIYLLTQGSIDFIQNYN